MIGCELTPSGQRAAAALASVYANWIPRSRIVTTNVFSSELAKLVANSMLAQRISSINSIAALCDDLGADVDEVASAIGTDTRIGSKFLKAGIGFGGSCFKKDLLSLCYLAETLHQPEVAQYWRAVLAMNEYARDRFVRRVVKALNNTLSGKKVVLLGYAFKKDTNDTRESPALEIIRSLVTEAPAEIAIYDPCCLAAHTRAEIRRLVGPGVLHGEGGRVVVHEDPYTACRDADAVLVTTEFDEFKYARPRPTMNGAPAKFSSRKAAPADPRPFRSTGPAKPEDERALSSSSYCPSELELLALHSHGIKSGAAADPLGRFRPMPACDEAACPDCQLERAATENGDGGDYGAGQEHVPKERMDWARVAGLMRPPRWVFDGRGVLDVRGMDALGFRIEGTGRQRKGL